jgi:hypothetical protein
MKKRTNKTNSTKGVIIHCAKSGLKKPRRNSHTQTLHPDVITHVKKNEFHHQFPAFQLHYIIPLALIAVGWLMVIGMLKVCRLLYCWLGAIPPGTPTPCDDVGSLMTELSEPVT